MRLRSTDISKSANAESDSCQENLDAVDGKESSFNCGSESLLDGIVVTRPNEAEHMVCVSEAADDKFHDKNDRKDVLPLDAKVLVSMENLIGLCAEREIDEERVECVSVGVKEGKELASVDLNELDSGLKEEIKSPPVISVGTCQLKVSVPTLPHKEAMECENRSENAQPGSIVLNTDVASGDADMTKERVKVEETTEFLNVEYKKDGDDTSFAVDENGEGTLGLKKHRRGRKRKFLGNQECKGDVRAKKEKTEKGGIQVGGRVLRSNAMTMSGGASVVDRELNESVAGFKRKMKAECLDETKLQKEVAESTQVTGSRQKKQKRRGRPPKVQGEAGFKTKMKAGCLDQTELHKKVEESIQQKRRGRPPKAQGKATPLQVTDEEVVSVKSIRRGRPPKVQGEELAVQEIQKNKHKDTVVKNLKRRGRPPKVQTGNLTTHVANANKRKHMVVKKNNTKLKAKDVKERPKIHNVQKEVGVSESRSDNKQKVKVFEEGNDHTTVEDTAKQSKNSIGGLERRKKQQLVRDQIVSMIMKAGWIIEYRPRQEREYLDAVYVDRNGRTHWSITKAYRSLKKKVEDGEATSEEVSAFTPIPDEEMSVLFRLTTKIRCDKNKKKKKWKNISKAEIVISGEAPPKKPGKKTKDGTKRKQMHNSALKVSDKSSGFKVRADKSPHEHGVIRVSSFQRRPKVSQKSRQNRKPLLVARSSGKGLDKDNDGCIKYSWKRNILSWMIDLGVIMPGGKVQYREGRKKSGLSEGKVTCDGIHCSCCNEIMDMSKFVSHGGGKLSQALENIYFQSGSSLLKCLLESWRKEEESSSIRFNYVDVEGDDPNDDTCNICGDGGDLTCCDGCPSTFHQSCLDIQNFPSGDWHCIYCSCKFCGVVARSASQMDDSHHAPSFEMLSCCLCEEKFHQLCLQEEDAVNFGSINLPFCGRTCQELFEQLQKYLGVKFELEEGFSWTLLQRSDVSQDSKLLDAPQKVECNSKLAVAFSVMDECFVPIMDERSGVNMIHNVVYNCGSNFRRLNYSGFFTAILERGDELISAASIRIHGHRLAEMPFIGTRHMYRRQGMCRRLLDAIEYALGSLGVGELVIPAIPELFKTWTKVFGFRPLEVSERQTMKCMSMIVFPGTDMLQKPLLRNQFVDKRLSSAAVLDDHPVKGISEVNDENVLLQSKSSNAIDYEQMPASMEEAALLKDCCRYPDEDATHLKSETPTTTLLVPESTGVLASEAKSERLVQHVPSDSDVQSSDDLVREGVGGVKISPSTSKVVLKNTFDLNLQPAATDIDIQSIDDDTLSTDPQVCKKHSTYLTRLLTLKTMV